MRLGILIAPVAGDDPDAVPGMARRYEAAGFDSVWTAQAVGRGFMMMDPLVAMAVAAAVTARVELGTAILQLPLYNPTDVALKAWSVAQISGGRFRLGVGAGSTRQDFEAHGLAFDDRFRRFEAALKALQDVLVTGAANGVALTPYPAVSPPPLLFGTWTRNAERAAREFDGWMASGMHTPIEDAIAALDRYRAAGGQRALVTTIMAGSDTDPGELRARLTRYREAGFDDAIVMPLPGGPSLDTLRALV